MTRLKEADTAPTSRSRRPALRECGIAHRAARHRATEPPYYSAHGRAVYMGKGGRYLRPEEMTVGEMPSAELFQGHRQHSAVVVRYWKAQCGESRTLRLGRGGQKRLGHPGPRWPPTPLARIGTASNWPGRWPATGTVRHRDLYIDAFATQHGIAGGDDASGRLHGARCRRTQDEAALVHAEFTKSCVARSDKP